MKIGLDVFLEEQYKQFKNNRIGLVTNMTGVNHQLTPTIDLFYNHPDINLVALYAPEHGIRGDAKEGEAVESETDPLTNLPVYSLYGETRRPSEKMLEPVDVVIFDLQDIGSRYYTYIYTMAYVMSACGEYGKKFVVLDRPNPISGVKLEGNLVEEDTRSFVGMVPIPNRHGMTVGELARLFKNEFNYSCDLTVIEMKGWRRDYYFEDTDLFWVSPSPNTTNINMMILYPGTCLVEGTNLSEGRGTTRPFEQVGAPFMDGHKVAQAFNEQGIPGVIARPTSFVPTYQKYKDKVCGGIQLHVIDREQLNSFQAGVRLLETIAQLYPDEFEFTQHKSGNYFFDLLAGTKRLKTIILDRTSESFFKQCDEQIASFIKIRKPYLLYK